jgi:signal transduction histidine kinase/ActR/RegA family two-component response regulator
MSSGIPTLDVQPGLESMSPPSESAESEPNRDRPRGFHPAGHSARFYENDRFPAGAVGAYVAEALLADVASMVVATPAHLALITLAIAESGVNVDAVTAGGQLVLVDAETMLADLLVDGKVDAAMFRARIGKRVRALLKRFPTARVFGEMVDLLSERGQVSDALRLEGMWNKLRETLPFDLLCAYGFKSFEDASAVAGFAKVCSEHSSVEVHDGEGKEAAVGDEHVHAHLEQGRRALLTEVKRRRELEAERERQLAVEQFLNEAGRILGSSLDYEATVRHVAELAVPTFADLCFLDLLDESGSAFDRVAVGHHRPEDAELARALEHECSLAEGGSVGVAGVIQERNPRLIRELTPETMHVLACDERHLDALQRANALSCVTAPLLARGRAMGAITLVSCVRHMDERDQALAQGFARSAAAAIDNARLFRAEARARQRTARMQEVTAALSRASTARDVAEVACRIGSEAMEAHSGALWLGQLDGSLHLAGSWGTPRSFMDQFRVVPAGAVGIPAFDVVREAQATWVETEEDYRRDSPEIYESVKRANRLSAYGAVPLFTEGRAAGVIVFAHQIGHRYDADERAFYANLAEICSQALDRARLLDVERRSNERLGLLARAGEALWASLDVEETLRGLVHLMVPAFADLASVFMLEGEELRPVDVAHSDPSLAGLVAEIVERYPSKRSEAAGLGAVLRSKKTHWLSTVGDDLLRRIAHDEEHFLALKRLAPRSSIVTPVFAGDEGGAVVLFLTAESERVYDKGDCEFAEEIARRAGLAIERARLHRAAERAARRAEEANRVKDEFLATVSHELRTPLTAIGGWSEIIARKAIDPTITKGLDVIRRNVRVQAKIIDDILDVSRIITGKMKLEMGPVDMTAIARDALDVVRPSVDAKGLGLAFQAPESACVLVGDAARLQQIVWNLLSNAVKFTDAGGRVTLQVEQEGSSVVVTVSDTGRGIEPGFLPYVFDRFRQADGSSTRRFGGLGLGLAIVRHIVELHGGHVAAESPGSGQGATFRVDLPVRAVAPLDPFQLSESSESLDEAPRTMGDITGIRLLVVDDEADARDLLQTVVTGAGGSAEVVASAAEALEAVQRFQPDVIVCDIGMPDADGYSFIRQLRARSRDRGGAVPTIALTAYSRKEDRMRALSAGFSAHLAKPIDADELVAVIASLHAMGTG